MNFTTKLIFVKQKELANKGLDFLETSFYNVIMNIKTAKKNRKNLKGNLLRHEFMIRAFLLGGRGCPFILRRVT